MIVKFKKVAGDFITIERFPIDKDTQLSFKAKGILTYLMGRPETWKPNMKEIAQHAKDGEGAIKRGIYELQKAGYVIIQRLKDKDTGKMRGWQWTVYDIPHGKRPKVQNSPSDEKPKVQNNLSESSTVIQATIGKTESSKSDFRFLNFDSNKECNKKDCCSYKEGTPPTQSVYIPRTIPAPQANQQKPLSNTSQEELNRKKLRKQMEGLSNG